MQSLKQARKKSKLKQSEIIDLIGITQGTLSHAENYTTRPASKTRKQLELLFGKINWLDVPRLDIKTVNPPSNWAYTEKAFISFLKKVISLEPEEQQAFLSSAIRHMRQIKNSIK